MNDDYEQIPGMPGDEAIRAELVRTGGPAYWRPFGTAEEGNGYNGRETDFSTVTEEAKAKILSTRLRVGPGPTGTPYQHALWEHHNRQIALEKEAAEILERMTAVIYDPVTGEGISKAPTDQVQADSHRLSQIRAELERHRGAAGELKLERALAKAVEAEKARYRHEYVLAEAKRRAAQSSLDEEIERRAAGYRRGLTAINR
mgnify:CR=1 FL=1